MACFKPFSHHLIAKLKQNILDHKCGRWKPKERGKKREKEGKGEKNKGIFPCSHGLVERETLKEPWCSLTSR